MVSVEHEADAWLEELLELSCELEELLEELEALFQNTKVSLPPLPVMMSHEEPPTRVSALAEPVRLFCAVAEPMMVSLAASAEVWLASIVTPAVFADASMDVKCVWFEEVLNTNA